MKNLFLKENFLIKKFKRKFVLQVNRWFVFFFVNDVVRQEYVCFVQRDVGNIVFFEFRSSKVFQLFVLVDCYLYINIYIDMDIDVGNFVEYF